MAEKLTPEEIFENEIKCVKRRSNGQCNGGVDCCTCDLLMNEQDIISAYERAIDNINLINRQQSQIDTMLENLQFRTNQVIEQQAEIERLQNEIGSLNKKYPCTVQLGEHCLMYARSLDDYDKQIGDISSEAIKEFADLVDKDINEKLSDSIKEQNPHLYLIHQIVKDRLKEMVGEDK